MLKYLVLLLLLICCFSLHKSHAQQSDTTANSQSGYDASPEMMGLKLSGRTFVFSAGYQNTDYSFLDKPFNDAGIPLINPNMAVIGGMVVGVVQNIVGGLSAGSSFPVDNSNANYITESTDGYVHIFAGYIVAHRRSWYTYPSLGFYINTSEVNIRPNQATPGFNTVLNNPAQSANLTITNYMINVSMHHNWRLSGTETYRNGSDGNILGIEAGYSYAVSRPDWELDLQSMPGTPANRYGLFFVRVSFGFSTISESL